jgi:hypothetical protein
MDEALVEHAVAKDLIAQLEDTSPEDDLYEVTVLGEQIDHHVKERHTCCLRSRVKAARVG